MLFAEVSAVIVGVPHNTDSPDTFAKDACGTIILLTDPVGPLVIGAS
jgi:hypothetical protein